MALITSELLHYFPFYNYTDYRVVQRGYQYYHERRVGDIEFFGDRAECWVKGKSGIYKVVINLYGKDDLEFSCTCPYADSNNYCKHMVAAVQAIRDYLNSEEIRNRWDYVLTSIIEENPPRRKTKRTSPYAILYFLEKREYFHDTLWKLNPLVLRANKWKPLKDATTKTREEINQLLENNSGWNDQVSSPTQPINQEGCLNQSSEGVAFFNFLLLENIQHSFYRTSFYNYLALIKDLDAPIFHISKEHSGLERIKINTETISIQANLNKKGKFFVLDIAPDFDNENENPLTIDKKNLFVLSEDPAWMLAGDTILPVSNPESLPLVKSFPLKIPLEQENDFRQTYLQHILNYLPVKGDLIHWQEINNGPIPRLYLHEDSGRLLAELRFAYQHYEMDAEKDPEETETIISRSSWDITRITRDLEKENFFLDMLKTPAFRLKKAGREYPENLYELRARAHPFDFLLYSIPQLTREGFEIFGEENIKSARINRSTPKISLSITSGIDWFDLKAEVEYGDQKVSLKDIRKAVKKGERYVKLADGSIGQIPEEWLEKYRYLWGLAEETEDGYRLTDFQLPLVDELLGDPGEVIIPADLMERRQKLLSFEKIQQKTLPQVFFGELRPYQKAGFDWLFFLQDYKFGGILADDMGLGKTIQMLAYLQSKKENSSGRPVSLLVVPKSLITNWQREAANFTPELTFLEHLGPGRTKNKADFKQFDIVLTTYGTMRQDVKLLRSFHFNHIILDESQAIKNPLSQTARAARLLEGEQRLCMTGTPVENNTFELWSQFAFLNPGLLGSLDFFKEEFAAPIESQDDQKAVETLRSLIYPFILRRTKEQVAPELPPRSERVLYTEMSPHQKRLYDKTREHYRSELLGLIEAEGGMNNARMKILEGLLRLRQISIHPALADPAYKYDAPKYERLLETLETLQTENHKALIFSQFIKALDLLRSELDGRGIPYAYLDGQTKDRQAQVDTFQSDPQIPFFLISLKAGGVGLNLTAADYVIHIDPWWNPAVELQASDRAHRIGQDKPVFVYKLITRDSVEEKILLLQEKKKDLVENLISSESSFFKSLTGDDVKALFG